MTEHPAPINQIRAASEVKPLTIVEREAARIRCNIFLCSCTFWENSFLTSQLHYVSRVASGTRMTVGLLRFLRFFLESI
jgi:hypothetical protein